MSIDQIQGNTVTGEQARRSLGDGPYIDTNSTASFVQIPSQVWDEMQRNRLTPEERITLRHILAATIAATSWPDQRDKLREIMKKI